MKLLYFIPFVLAISLLFVQCKNGKGKIEPTPRDVSITKKNSFSELFLDSVIVAKYITEHKLNEETAERLLNFYNSRNYSFAWFNKHGLAEQATAFWNLHNNYVGSTNDSSIYSKQLHLQMETLLESDSVQVISPGDIAETELMLTEHFFEYAQYAYTGKIDPSELQWHIPRKKIDASVLLDSLVATGGKNVDAWEPVSEQYKWMRAELNRFKSLTNNWVEITPVKKALKPGDSSIAIAQVKQRLVALGYFNGNDISEKYSAGFEQVIQQAQGQFGLSQDGVIGPAFLAALNVTPQQRIEQLLVNMERMRWMPETPKGKRITVNIPAFKMTVFEGKEKQFEIDVVVGTAANRTVIFNDKLQYVVFSPYWNIPRSIVRNEILPAMNRNRNYLARKNMEQTGTSNGLPVIRQKPGGSNSLGRVKFIFPNSYNIYFHDTPAKSLFGRESRAFSHGCIRLAEPKKLAEYLLADQPEWTPGKINQAMYAETEKWVKVTEEVPVQISYFTAWIGDNGLVHFAKDIYGHDKKLAEQLFTQVTN